MPCLFSSKKPRKQDHGIVINPDGTGYVYSKSSKTLKTKMIAPMPPPPPPPTKDDIIKIIADAFAKSAAENKREEEMKMLRGQVAGFQKESMDRERATLMGALQKLERQEKTGHDRAALAKILEKIEKLERQERKRKEEEKLQKMMEKYGFGPSSEGGLVRNGGGPNWGGGGGYGNAIIPLATLPAVPLQYQRLIECGHESGISSVVKDERLDRIEAWILRNSR